MPEEASADIIGDEGKKETTMKARDHGAMGSMAKTQYRASRFAQVSKKCGAKQEDKYAAVPPELFNKMEMCAWASAFQDYGGWAAVYAAGQIMRLISFYPCRECPVANLTVTA